MHPIKCFFLLQLFCFLLALSAAQPFDYPTAGLSAQWTNNPSIEHKVTYPDGDNQYGATVRAILLRGSYGPSFACGFFCLGACKSFLFSIFIVYTNSGSQMTGLRFASPQVVWVANRDHPVQENATLQLSSDGNLVLRDVDGSTVWSTNTSGRSVVGMNITDVGTLELFDKSNSSVWSSIDHPTDTWVLGQTLRQGQRLTANVSTTNSTQGQLYLSIVNGGFATYVGSNPPQLYYQNVDSTRNKANNRSTYITFTNGSLAIFTQSNDPRSPDMTIPLPLASSVQYMRLDYGGHLRLYAWNTTDGIMQGWMLKGDVFDLYPDDCAYPTVCGEYGICSDGQCSCPAGTGSNSTFFRQIDARQPNLGCAPVATLSCESNRSHQLLALRDVSYFNYADYNAAAMHGTNEESCKETCMRNCSCKAAFFRYTSNASDGHCFLTSQLFSMSNNNPDISHTNSSAFIKVQSPQSATIPNTPNVSGSTEKKSAAVSVIVGSAVGAVFVASLVACLIFVFIRRRKDKAFEEDDQFEMVPGIPARFSLDELKIATEDFCSILGAGGFGSVFEGRLSDGTKIAAKRLDGVGQGKKEFLAEVETIGSIHHINLVRLIGFCAEKSCRILVYEYMSNGSLDKWIFSKCQDDTALDWQTRCRIIADIAKGLAYLHEECRQKIVHLDIKPQNILLDENFNAKVSDFGLSKLIERDQSNVMTKMRGTPGYLAPEWLTSVITEKADVYSFGVVVMEIVCGRKNLDYSQPEECIHLLSLLQEKAEEDRISDIIDHRSDMQLHINEVIEMMKLSMWCLQSDSNKRPSMSLVLKVLQGSMTADSHIDYNFSSPAPFVHHNANNALSAPPSAALLSGPR